MAMLTFAGASAAAATARTGAAKLASALTKQSAPVANSMRTRGLKTAITRQRAARVAAPLPVVYSLPLAGVAGLPPGASPAGANDWSCRPSAAHPRPVVLVEGTGGNMADNWFTLSPLLANAGYCVFALNYGDKGLPFFKGVGPVAASAVELRDFVDRVLAATGVSQVDIVGHSQGGMMPRQYMKFEGGGTKVRTLIGLAPSNHGTTGVGMLTLLESIPGGPTLLGTVCDACNDQHAGSPTLTALNAGGDTLPGVRYLVIATTRDEVVTPYTSGFLSGPNVTNMTVQDGCPINQTDHLAIAFDRRALTLVLNELDPAHPRPVPCNLSLPGLGSG